MKQLEGAPDCIFDWYIESEEEGYIPSVDDFEQEFGEFYNVQHWADKLGLPDCRQEIEGEVDNVEFTWQTLDQHLKDRGMKLADFY